MLIAGSKTLRAPTKIVRLKLFDEIPQTRRQLNPVQFRHQTTIHPEVAENIVTCHHEPEENM